MKKDFHSLLKALPIALGVGVIVAGLIWAITSRLATTYDAQTTWTVSKSSSLSQQKTDYYLYDQYYITLASQQYADIIQAWFTSAGIVEQVYQKADVPLPTIKPAKIGKLIRVTKRPPANLAVRFRAENEQDADRLAVAGYDVFSERLSQISKGEQDTYQIIAAPVYTSMNQVNTSFLALIGFLGAALATLVLWGTILYIVREA